MTPNPAPMPLLAKIDLRLHHGNDVAKGGKGNEAPLDATITPFSFVGWRIHGGTITVQRKTIDAMTARVIQAETRRERSLYSNQLLDVVELHKDWRKRIPILVAKLYRRDPEIAAGFARCARLRATHSC